MSTPLDLAFSPGALVRILLLLTGGFLAHRFIQPLVTRLDKVVARGPEGAAAYKERVDTIEGVIHNIVSIGIWGVVLFMVLAEIGVDIAPLIASAGVVGLAIGFGSQQLVKDFLSGFFILLENQYGKGDRIEIAGKTGEVREINLRTTILNSDDGKTHIIPNSSISIVTRGADSNP